MPPALSAALSLLLLGAPPAASQESFRIEEGGKINLFYRDRDVAAHAVVTPHGPRRRIVLAFPAGNSGAGLWLEDPAGGEAFQVRGALRKTSEGGVALDVECAAPELRVRRLLLDTVRGLRDFSQGSYAWREETLERLARALASASAQRREELSRRGITLDRVQAWRSPPARPLAGGAGWEWFREAVGSGAAYRLRLIARAGTRIESEQGGAIIRGSARGGGTRFSVEAAVGYPPLTPIAPAELLNGRGRSCVARGAGSRRLAESLRSLAFLSYREKSLAGSWQYLTYFGRDTLISARLLGPILATDPIEAALRAVLDRLSDAGAVAHEEDIGDQASLRRLEALAAALEKDLSWSGEAEPLDRPLHDYKMIDGEFLLPLLAAQYAERAGAARLQAFLASPSLRGETYGSALARAAERVLSLARPYAEARERGVAGPALARLLVSLQPGLPVGDWRDSEEGLGRGRYPSSVNAGLVAPALRACARALELAGSAGSEPARAELERQGGAQGIERVAAAWDLAHEHFRVALSVAEVRSRLGRYLDSFPAEERRALERTPLGSGSLADFLAGKTLPEALREGLSFWALSLDAEGRPIAVQSSDVGFALAESSLTPDQALEAATVLALPFPAGLSSPVGLLVANPAFSERAEDFARFGRDRYHGAVAWSWPLVVARLGLERQLRAVPPGHAARAVLRRGLAAIRAGERAVGALRASELWSWRVEGGRLRPAAFGAGASDATESNAVQLWSTLNLAADCAAPGPPFD